MSQGGRAEQVSFLRESIARIGPGTALASRGGSLCEVLPASHGDAPAATGFALALACRRAGARGAIVWVYDEMSWRQHGAPHAPGLADHGLALSQIVLVRTTNAAQTLWTIEEALRSPAPAVVIGEVWDAARHCDLTMTRRLLLAARAGGALGVLLHGLPAPGALSTAARQRFEVRALPGQTRASAGGRKPIFSAPAWQARQLKGVPAPMIAALTTSDERKLFGAALSQPVHSRARA
jgi:protein ImuA